MTNIIDEIKNNYLKWIEEIREWFHMYPEPSKLEFNTSKKIQEILLDLGYEIDTSFSKTSIIAKLKKGSSERVVAFRSDMDGLPIKEENLVGYKSKNEGYSHACGHDGHMAIALGAAKYFSNSNFNGTIIFIFQCAEEIGFGANELIINGLFTKYKIDNLFALHGINNKSLKKNYNPGTICFSKSVEPITANVKIFDVKFTGKGGHGSEPENTIDPIPAAIEYINSLYYVKARNISGFDKNVLSICHISSGSGTAANIIPDFCIVKGTFRTFTDVAQNEYINKIKDYAKITANKFGLSYEINFMGTESTKNNDELNSYIKKITKNELGKEYVGNATQLMIGEDFSLYGKYTKICLAYISTGENVPIHNSKYDFGHKPLLYGVAYYVNIVKNLLN